MVNIEDDMEDFQQKKNAINVSKLSEVETLNLIHELEVHQIELEMQKEELIVAKEQAEIATQKYAELYDFAPSGYFTLTKTGKITHLNFTGSQLLQTERSKLINHQFGLFISEDTKLNFNEFLDTIFNTSQKECCEVKLLLKNNSTINVYLSGVLSENKDEALITSVDITQLKLTEGALKESGMRYRELLNNLDVGIILHNKDKSIIFSNPKASELIGLEVDQINGRKKVNPGWEFIQSDNQPLTQENYPVNEILRTKKLLKNFIIGFKKSQHASIQWF